MFHYTSKRLHATQSIEITQTVMDGKPAVQVVLYEAGEVKQTFIRPLKTDTECTQFANTVRFLIEKAPVYVS